MILSSPAFQDKGLIPTKYAYKTVSGGKNISIPLTWKDVPSGTKSFALSIIDPHPVANNWVHWLVVNIPGTVTSLPEGASPQKMPAGSKELYGTDGELNYCGPAPPKGSGPHPYEVTLYALNADSIDISANISRTAFLEALEKKTIVKAMITGIYER